MAARIRWPFTCVLIALSAATPAFAQADADASAMPANTRGAVLTVGTKAAPPFVIEDGRGRRSGISIALWEAVAKRLGIQTHYVDRPLDGLFTGLDSGALNVSVAALTVTADRESRIDFSYPFYSTGLTIAVPSGGNRVWATIKSLVSGPFLAALAALALVLLIAGAAVWLFERRANEQFGGSPAHGLASGFWWAAVTMTTVGYGDKAPRTPGGRLVGLVWMFAAVIIISTFTAGIATSLTVGQLSGIKGVDDLKNARVATVADSAAAGALSRRGIAFNTRASLDSALAALASHKVDAVVYDAPLLRYHVLNGYADKIQVLAHVFERQDYAFALPQGSKLREPIDRAILAVLATDAWQTTLNRYLGAPP